MYEIDRFQKSCTGLVVRDLRNVSLDATNVLSAVVLLMSGCLVCFLCALDWMGKQAEQREKKKYGF